MTPNNGRRQLQDLLEELLDAAAYTKTEMIERALLEARNRALEGALRELLDLAGDPVQDAVRLWAGSAESPGELARAARRQEVRARCRALLEEGAPGA